MNWYKYAEDMTNEELTKRIREIIRRSPLFLQVFKSFDMPIKMVDKLKFEIKDLGDKFAEADGESIALDKKLFEQNRFFEDHFHFVAHEINHWLKRKSEDMWYFNDEEEVQSFVLAIAWELSQGRGLEDIRDKIFTIIKTHFKDNRGAEEVFENMISKARELVSGLIR